MFQKKTVEAVEAPPAHVRLIIESIVSHNWAFTKGEVWKVKTGDTMPAVMARVSEEYAGPVDHTAKIFDAADWARANAPRVEPAPPEELDAAGIQRRFRIDVGDARPFGFPKPTRITERVVEGVLGDVHLEREKWWNVEAVGAWLSHLRAAIGGAK